MQAQGQKVQDSTLPFEKVNVRASPAPQPQQQQHVQQKQVGLAFFVLFMDFDSLTGNRRKY